MKKKNLHKWAIALTIVLSISLIILSVIYAFNRSWGKLMLAIAIMLSLFIPFIANHFTRKKGISISSGVIIAYLLTQFLTFYLGDMCDLYNKFFWWDDMLHILSGIIFTIAGFYIINIVNVKEKATLITSSFFIVLFSFCLANTLGVVWEIAEFATDQFHMTKGSQTDLPDTMRDMIENMAGALVTGVFYYFCRKKKINKMNI